MARGCGLPLLAVLRRREEAGACLTELVLAQRRGQLGSRALLLERLGDQLPARLAV